MGDAGGGFEFDAVALAVVKREGEGGEAIAAGAGEGGGGVEAAGEEADGGFHRWASRGRERLIQ